MVVVQLLNTAVAVDDDIEPDQDSVAREVLDLTVCEDIDPAHDDIAREEVLALTVDENIDPDHNDIVKKMVALDNMNLFGVEPILQWLELCSHCSQHSSPSGLGKYPHGID